LSTTTTWKQKRGRLARLSKDLPADDPQLVALRRDLAADRLAEHIEKVVSEAPPLTMEQRDRIAAILRSGTQDGAA
jgi:hypothetical protein